MENQGLPKAMIMGIVGLIFVVMFGSSMFVTIDSGEKGVLFKKVWRRIGKRSSIWTRFSYDSTLE